MPLKGESSGEYSVVMREMIIYMYALVNVDVTYTCTRVQHAKLRLLYLQVACLVDPESLYMLIVISASYRSQSIILCLD